MRHRFSGSSFLKIFRNREVFLSCLRSYALVLVIPFLVSVFFYIISINETQAYATQLNNNVLISASESFDMHLQEVRNIAHEITYNPSVRAFQSNTSGFMYPYVYKMVEVRNSLEGYSLIQSFVDQYFLFFNNSQIVMNDHIIYKYEDFFADYLRFADDVHDRFIQDLNALTLETGLVPAREITILEEMGSYLSMTQPLIGMGNGYLIILMDEQKVASLFSDINLGENGAVYIANRSGQMLTSTTGSACDLEGLYEATIQRVLTHPKETDFLLDTQCGSMLVNHLYTSANGLSYVSIQPVDVIMARVNIYRNLMVVCLCVSLAAGLLLCLRQAKRISTPLTVILGAVGMHGDDSDNALQIIQDMVVTLQTDNENLQRLASEHNALLRSSFASRLLRGSFSSEAEADRICQYVYPDYVHFSTARVLLFHLQPQISDDDADSMLKLLGSMKMVLKEVLDSLFKQTLYYDVDEETLALIVFNRSRDAIDGLYQKLYEEIPLYFRECIHAFGGDEVTPPLPKISRSFEQARTTMTMHTLSPGWDNGVLKWSNYNASTVQYFYPPDVSYRLTEAVIHGNITDVDQALNELFRVNFIDHPVPPPVGRLFLSELLSTAISCLPLMSSRGEISDDMLNECLSTISEAPTKRQFGLLREFFHALAKCAEKNRQESGGEKIRQVIDYLNDHFRDSSLSLLSIAEAFDVNASILSTSFKQQTGKNLSAYLENLRIQEAQRLLRTTNMTINQISQKVGYLSANSFCRAFRRNTGYNTSTYKSMT